MSELFDVDVAAARSGEEDARVDPRRHRVERLDHTLTERHRADAAGRLPALLELAAAEPSPGVHEACVAVDVAAFERDAFLRPWSGPCGEDRDSPIARVEL